jgi:hypothetical protein
MRATFLSITILLAACGGDLPPQSFIEKLRVLAVQADPPEVAPEEETRLSVLAASPTVVQLSNGIPPAPVSTLWLACTIPPGASSTIPCGVNPERSLGAGGAIPPSCDEAPGADLCVLGLGPTARFTPAASLLGGAASRQLLITAVVADTEGGAIGCLQDAFANDGRPTTPDHCVLALKRLTLSDPARRTAARNENPRLAEFLLDEYGVPVSLADGQALFGAAPESNPRAYTLIARRAEDAAQQYPKLDDQGQPGDLVYEALTISYYTTSGKLAGLRGAFDPEGEGCLTAADCPTKPPALETTVEWTPPAPSALAKTTTPADPAVRLYAVLRDDRGGVSWIAGRATPR